jgi:hypothetical protein
MHRHLLAPPPLQLLEGLATGATQAMVGRMLSKQSAKRPTLDDVLALLSATDG